MRCIGLVWAWAVVYMLSLTAAAQGARPITPETHAAAVAEGMRGEALLNLPFSIRLHVVGDSRAVTDYKELPFSFRIETPYSFVVTKVAFDVTKFKKPTAPSIDDANAKLVTIEVNPGRQLQTADAIENVVIKRGATVIRPVSADVVPRTFTTGLGVKRELSEGTFRFPFAAFDAGSSMTIVLIGKRGNFEWTMSGAEIAAIR